MNYRILLAFIIGLSLGIFVTYSYFPRTVEVPGQTTVITEVQYVDRTTVQYVPKESPDDSDVEINKGQPNVSVSFNGEKYDFDLIQGEEHKFDQGKLVVDQSSSLKVDVSAQVEKQIEQSIKKAFDEQEKKPKYRVGIEAEVDSEENPQASLRVSRQAKTMDIDLRISKGKKVTVGATWWFK